MKLALKRLENVGWLALVLLVLIMLYPLSLRVATLRSDLNRVDRQIISIKQDIRYLETEFQTRASLRQLERWNRLEFGYAPPSAKQFVGGERALANLGTADWDRPVEVAILTSMDDVKPAGIIGSVFGTAQARETEVEDAPTPKADKASAGAQISNPPTPVAVQSKSQRMANLDEKLLGPSVLQELKAAANKEQKRPNKP
jgi:hypothetical protein